MTQENIPVKYTLGMWKTLPQYPTKLDVLYEIYNYSFRQEKAEFSEQTFNSIWYDEKGSGNWKGTKIEILVKDLIKDGTIKEAKKTGDKVWYTLNNKQNPFK